MVTDEAISGGLESIVDEPINIVMSACHNISRKSRKKTDDRTRRKAEEYGKKGGMVSYKFNRAFDDEVDENKFLIPLDDYDSSIRTQLTYGYVSSIPIQLTRLLSKLSSLKRKANIPIVGSGEVDLYLELFKKYMKEKHKTNLDFVWHVPEGSIDDICVSNSIKKGKNSIKERTGNDPSKYIFFPLDVPFSNMGKIIEDYDGFDTNEFDLALKLNNKKALKDLFTRNFYVIITGEEIKEPNVFYFSGKFDNWDLIDKIYKRRQRKGLYTLIIKTMWQIYKEKQISSKDLKWIFFESIKHKKIAVTKDLATKIANRMSGYKINISYNKDDPFLVKDIDAYHDLFYYRAIFRKLKEENKDSKYDGLEKVLGEKNAKIIHGFNEFLEKQPNEIKQKLRIIYDQNYIENRCRDIGAKEYFENGIFKEKTRNDEHIPESIKFIKKVV